MSEGCVAEWGGERRCYGDEEEGDDDPFVGKYGRCC